MSSLCSCQLSAKHRKYVRHCGLHDFTELHFRSSEEWLGFFMYRLIECQIQAACIVSHIARGHTWQDGIWSNEAKQTCVPAQTADSLRSVNN